MELSDLGPQRVGQDGDGSFHVALRFLRAVFFQKHVLCKLCFSVSRIVRFVHMIFLFAFANHEYSGSWLNYRTERECSRVFFYF